jgi:predicted nucleic acid-binding protein
MKVYNGRIYKFKGAMVRALVKTDNGMRVVQTAQKLNGFAHDHELEHVSKKEVNEYVRKSLNTKDLRRAGGATRKSLTIKHLQTLLNYLYNFFSY